MLFGYSLRLHQMIKTQNLNVNKTKHGSGHYSGVVWDVCGS